MPNPNNKNIVKDIDLKIQCPECKKWFNVPLLSHHFITYHMKRYLISVGRFDEKQVDALRRKMQIRLCRKCEQQKHDNDVYEIAWKNYMKKIQEANEE